MRQKSLELNQEFQTNKWTPRKIDMVLWACGRRKKDVVTTTTANIYIHLDYSSKIASANAILGVYPAQNSAPKKK